MFSQYATFVHKKPQNSEEECICPDPENHIKNAVLAEIADICELRCDYNLELLRFFASSTISEAEKKERLLSLYPQIAKYEKNLRQKGIIFVNPCKVFTQFCENDLNIFYHALKTIERYENHQYPEDFPIFFELSEIFKISLAELLTQSPQNTEIIQYSDQNSEEKFFRTCIAKLKRHVEADIQTASDSFFKIKTTLEHTYYEFKNQEAYQTFIRGNHEEQALFVSYTLKYPKLAYPTPGVAEDALSQKISQSLNKIFLLMLEQSKLAAIYTEYAIQIGQITNKTIKSAIYLTSLHRQFFYSFHALHVERKKAFLQSHQYLEEWDKKSETIPHLTSKNTPPAVSTDILAKTQVLAPILNPPPSDVIEKVIESGNEKDICRAYIELKTLKEKKLKRLQAQFGSVPEHKENPTIDHQQATLIRLQAYCLKKNHIVTLEKIFMTPVPHYKIRWDELKKLIRKCGGSVGKETGSSRRVIRLPAYQINTLMDKPLTQRGIHESHQPGHKNATISRWSVKILRTALERAGITEAIIHELKQTIELNSAKPMLNPNRSRFKQ